MTQQQPNLRRSMRIVRRYKGIVGGFAFLGLVAGVGYAVLNPPQQTSSALVILPTPKPNIQTDTLIAESAPVLTAALPKIGHGMTLTALHQGITATDATGNVISVNAKDKTAAEAEDDANAVAASFLSFIGSANSPVGAVAGRVFVPASTATSGGAVKQFILYGPIGLLAGLLIGFIVALRRDRGDRRLRTRDEIANSIGVPVLAAVEADQPGDAQAWLRLLAEYQPDAVQAWTLRTTLARLRSASGGAGPGQNTGSGNGAGGVGGHGRTAIAVVSPAADPAALAIGPQLAVFASSLGIPTALIVCAQAPGEANTTLRAAAAAWSPASAAQANTLRVIAASDADLQGALPGAALTVIVTTVDDAAPRVSEAVRAHATVLAVSPRVATPEQLARVAASAADAGGNVVGIMVANPEPGDATTGFAPAMGRQPRVLPTRMNGTTRAPRGNGVVATMREERR
jgi:capsular polysaccharide biosynthesis protein